MGKYEFFEGQELLAIWWDDAQVDKNVGGVVSITVSMESGQMAGVPWAAVLFADGRIIKHNLALASGVDLGHSIKGQ